VSGTETIYLKLAATFHVVEGSQSTHTHSHTWILTFYPCSIHKSVTAQDMYNSLCNPMIS
jgi:hypothetical protein